MDSMKRRKENSPFSSLGKIQKTDKNRIPPSFSMIELCACVGDLSRSGSSFFLSLLSSFLERLLNTDERRKADDCESRKKGGKK